MSNADKQLLADGGRLLQMRDRLAALGLQMASSTAVPFALAREVAELVDSPEFLAAEQALGRVQNGGAR